MALLDDTSDHVRLTAVYALGKVDDRQVLERLRKALREDSSAGVRRAAREVIDQYKYRSNR